MDKTKVSVFQLKTSIFFIHKEINKHKFLKLTSSPPAASPTVLSIGPSSTSEDDDSLKAKKHHNLI